MNIIKTCLTLSDGSFAFNVRVADGGERFDFAAVTEADADALAIKLRDAIMAHTVHLASVLAEG